MDAATLPDQGHGEPCVLGLTQAGQLLTLLARGPVTTADIRAIARDPYKLIHELKARGAVITCDRKAMPPVYTLEQMPPAHVLEKLCNTAPPKPKKPQGTRLHPSFEGTCWTAADFQRVTGLPATALPLRWHVGKFPAAVVFKCLADAAKQNPAYRPVLVALSAGVKNDC